MGGSGRLRRARWLRAGLLIGLLAAALSSRPASALPLPVAAMAWGDACVDKTDHYYSPVCRGRGVLGTGQQIGSATPVRIVLPAGTHLVQVSAGFAHSVGLTDDGHVLAWGSGYRGRLGDGRLQDRNTPGLVPIPTSFPVVAVSAGHDHSLALAADGVLWAWGFNRQGQIGNGTRATAAQPVQVHLPVGVRLRSIVAGGLHSLAITDRGRVLEWGATRLGEAQPIAQTEPREVPLPADADIVQVDGQNGSVAVARDGRVFAWSGICFPQVARFDDCRPEPHEVLLPDGVRVVQATSTRVLTESGQISEQVFRPYEGVEWRLLPLPAGAAVSRIDISESHVLALTRDRRVLAWGMNWARQLGTGSNEHQTGTPAYVSGLTDVLDIAAGSGFSLALRLDPGAA